MSHLYFSHHCKNTDIVNNLLSNYDLLDNWKLGSTMAIFVHSSIFEQFSKVSTMLCQENIIDQLYDYELKVGTTLYDMKLVYVRNHNELIENFISKFLFIQNSFIFDDKVNLFINESSYHQLKLFISMNYPEHNVDVQTRSGFCLDECGNTKITVVTFKEVNRDHRQIQLEISMKFLMFLLDKFPTSINTKYYYQTFAFPWLQPSRLKHFERPIHDKTYFNIHQFLTCLREVSYGKEPHANVLDLCNLRLAFCDDRGMNEYDQDLAFKIDSLIIRSLNYLKNTNLFVNKIFNVMLYATKRNMHSVFNYAIVRYFQYKFQNHFDSINMIDEYRQISKENVLQRYRYHIELRKQPDLKIVTQMTTTVFEIDIKDFNKMDIFTFFNIIKHRNVINILLDTNQEWFDSQQPTYLLLISWILAILSCKNKSILIERTNNQNFVNQFLSTLKSFPIWPSLMLQMRVPLQNYCAFNETQFSFIIFSGIQINTMMLQQLHNCKLNSTKIEIILCHLENEAASWELILCMENLDKVLILEEELTWPSLFECLSNKFMATDLNEFVFTKSHFQIWKSIRGRDIDLLLYTVKLKMDSNNSKIVLVKKDSKEEIDLYYLTNEIGDDKSEYDFYD